MKNIIKLEYNFYSLLNEACEIFEIKQASFTKLFEDIDYTPTNTDNTELNRDADIPTYLNNNKFAYGKKVKKYLEDSLNANEKELFESIKTFNSYNTIKFNDILNKINNSIKSLEKINDFNLLDGLPNTVVKTKVLLKKPIYVYGFDIMNSFNFMESIRTQFNLYPNNITEILYNKSEKELIHIYNDVYVTYNISNDEFRLNKLLKNQSINDIVGNNLISLYKNLQNIKFTDNLYADNFKQNVLKQIEQQKNFVK